LLARELLERGDDAEGADALDRAHEAYAGAGDPITAIQVVEELVLLRPEVLELRQRTVEYASQTSDSNLLARAFVELAVALRDSGDEDRSRAVLDRALSLDPNHDRARALLAELGGPETSHTIESSSPAETAPARDAALPSAAAPPAPSGDYVDLGALILDEPTEKVTRWTVPAEAPTSDEDADFRRTLALFKEKVAENLSTDDTKGHYDLGTAYKEMGLVDEAIGEFQQSLRADPANLAAFEMLGQCFLEKGEPQAAIRTLERGLKLPIQIEDDLLGIYYALGNSHEVVGNTDSAREFYERIFALDINFKDVTDRLRDLR
jgi:tetratricopeptide (TPR) repeat protein